MIEEMNITDIDCVSGGLTDYWMIVPREWWGILFGDLDYPDIPPKYRDGDGPEDWVY